MVLRYGTEAQKRFFVPAVCRGELFFAIGMSEPQAGSDLASVRTRATPTPTGWRINGQKIWTTNADHSHYMIALVRTSGAPEDRQRGLSQLLIDLKTPGITIRPIEDLTAKAFSEVFFSRHVYLPHDALSARRLGWAVTCEPPSRAARADHSSMVLLDKCLAFRRASERRPAALALAGRSPSTRRPLPRCRRRHGEGGAAASP